MKPDGQSPMFGFCTNCGRAHPTRVSEYESACPACGYRHFVNPVSAAVGIVRDARGDLLLIRRAKEPGRGLLGLPGGFVDVGESAEEAVRREVLEETNLRLGAVEYFTSLPNQYLFQGFVWPVLDLFFTAEVESFGEARAMTEVQALHITAPKDLKFDEIAFPSNARALRLYVERGR